MRHNITFNETMKSLMKMAWTMVRNNGMTMSAAMKQAWRAIKLQSQMHHEQVTFTFRKANGEIRKAVGTLASTMLPHRDESKPRKQRAPQYSSLCFFDVEKHEYRSFTIANLI